MSICGKIHKYVLVKTNMHMNMLSIPEIMRQPVDEIIEDPVIGLNVIPFSSSENATIIALSAEDITGVSEGTYHLYHDVWNKGLHNYELGPPTEESIIYLQAVKLDTSNDISDTTDYKATDAKPIQLLEDQIMALKEANGSEADNHLIMQNMHMNMESVPDVMIQPQAVDENIDFQITFAESGINFLTEDSNFYNASFNLKIEDSLGKEWIVRDVLGGN